MGYSDYVESQNEVYQEPVSNEDLFQSQYEKITKEIIEDKYTHEKLKEFYLWFVEAKSLKLTFLEKKDVDVIMELFEAQVCELLQTISKADHTPELYRMLNQARIILMVNLKRSVGTGNRMQFNERTALVTTMNQQFSNQIEQKKHGGIMKLFGR